MDNRRWFAILCGLLIIAALAVSLFNVSEFAGLFEPTPLLSWAWACYVDFALTVYTIAYIYTRARGQRTGVVRFGFYWFVALSLIANVTVVLTRYDDRRGAALIDALLASDAFLWGACVIYGASIPVSVLTFAHTIADSVAPATARTVTVDELYRERTAQDGALTDEQKQRWEEWAGNVVRNAATMDEWRKYNYGASFPYQATTEGDADHVYVDRGAKDNPRSMEWRVRSARQAQPGASKRDIAKATGLSATTVRKWWGEEATA